MWYVLEGQYGTDIDEARAQSRPAHLERLQSLLDDGRLLVAGPMPHTDAEDPGPAGFSGSLIIAEFPDIDAAHTWLSQDPYQAAGVYVQTSIRPLKKVLP